MSKKPKMRHYETLFGKIDEANASGFHLEATWIAYTILEDRLNSLLRQTGGEIIAKIKKNGEKTFVTINQKIRKLEERRLSNATLDKYFTIGLISILDEWIIKRNKLMHSLGDDIQSQKDLEIKIKKIGEDGKNLAREVADIARSVKNTVKNEKKQARILHKSQLLSMK